MITEEAVRGWLKAHPEEAQQLLSELVLFDRVSSESERTSVTDSTDTVPPPTAQTHSKGNAKKKDPLVLNQNVGNLSPSLGKPPIKITPHIQHLKGSNSSTSSSSGLGSYLDINRALNRNLSAQDLLAMDTTKYVRPSDVHYEISRVLYSSLNLDTVIRHVLSFAVTVVNAEKCSFWLVDGDSNELYSKWWDVLPDVEKVEKTFEDMQRRASYESAGVTIPMGGRNFAVEDFCKQESSGGNIAPEAEAQPTFRVNIGTGIVGYVAATKTGLNIPDAYKDPRFDQSVDKKTGNITRSILCLPVFGGPNTKAHPNGSLLGVATLVNKVAFDDDECSHDELHPSFTDADVSIFRDFLQTVGIAIHNSILYENITQKEAEAVAESKKSAALLEVANSIYGQRKAGDLFAKIIMNARDLTNASYASLFLMNRETKELRKVFDSSGDGGLVAHSVVSHVVITGEILNVEDVSLDTRFQSEIGNQDSQPVKSVLAAPILDGDMNIVGVTKLCNKLQEGNIIPFTKSDVQIMQAFSTFCGLALQKTIMYEALERERERLAITMEIMSYHATARLDEAAHLQSLLLENTITIDQISSPDFDPHVYSYSDLQLPVIMFQMFDDLGFLQRYQIPTDKLAKYILTVRKNYRQIQYHNYTHATSVAHALYLLAKQNILQEKGFSDVEIYAMFLAALNHDIDHRGTNNHFQKAANTNLASFYSSSTMERHHFNHAMTILNSPDLNILDSLSSENYKCCLEIIEKAILATDLAIFFKNKKAALELAETKAYNPASSNHKELLLSIALTCSDLSAMSKKWEHSKKTADSVYSEFFAQGDEEKKLGLPFSADIMNRENEPRIPKMQVDFYKFIVFPAFEIFQGLVGHKATHLLDQVKNNAKNWEELAENGVKYKVVEDITL